MFMPDLLSDVILGIPGKGPLRTSVQVVHCARVPSQEGKWGQVFSLNFDIQVVTPFFFFLILTFYLFLKFIHFSLKDNCFSAIHQQESTIGRQKASPSHRIPHPTPLGCHREVVTS